MGINVLSLFDGMSCGQIALERAGIEVSNYYASEIDKHAIKVCMANYPKTIQLGSVIEVQPWHLPQIDLLIGGSPCQGFSNAGKGLNFDDPRSALFFEFVRLLKQCQPKHFLLENVGMKKEWQDIISEHLGVQPIVINSEIFGAQSRKRLYWTNIPIRSLSDISSNVMLGDILDAEVDEKYFYQKGFDYHGDNAKVEATLHISGHDILKRAYNKKFKAPTITCCNGGNLQKKVYCAGRVRKLTPSEYEKLQGVPSGYTILLSDSGRYNVLGNGWEVNTISFIFKSLSQYANN